MKKIYKLIVCGVLAVMLIAGGTALANSANYNKSTAILKLWFDLCSTTKGNTNNHAKHYFNSAESGAPAVLGWCVDSNYGGCMPASLINEGTSQSRTYTYYIPAVGNSVTGRAYSSSDFGSYNIQGSVNFDY